MLSIWLKYRNPGKSETEREKVSKTLMKQRNYRQFVTNKKDGLGGIKDKIIDH